MCLEIAAVCSSLQLENVNSKHNSLCSKLRFGAETSKSINSRKYKILKVYRPRQDENTKN